MEQTVRMVMDLVMSRQGSGHTVLGGDEHSQRSGHTGTVMDNTVSRETDHSDRAIGKLH